MGTWEELVLTQRTIERRNREINSVTVCQKQKLRTTLETRLAIKNLRGRNSSLELFSIADCTNLLLKPGRRNLIPAFPSHPCLAPFLSVSFHLSRSCLNLPSAGISLCRQTRFPFSSVWMWLCSRAWTAESCSQAERCCVFTRSDLDEEITETLPFSACRNRNLKVCTFPSNTNQIARCNLKEQKWETGFKCARVLEKCFWIPA